MDNSFLNPEKAKNITVINDGQFIYPVWTADLKNWINKNGEINPKNYEDFCCDVEQISLLVIGSKEMIEFCDELNEAGSDYIRF